MDGLPAFTCTTCRGSTPLLAPAWRCACGGMLDLAPSTAPWEVDPDASGQWRHRSRFALPPGWEGWRDLTMGEGSAPLLRAGGVLCSLELASPTLSFKDRGAVLLVARALLGGARHLVIDSSGNAGTAVAAYAARAGLPCTVVVPAATSPAKLVQAAAHGAEVVRVDGDRAAAAAAALDLVADGSSWYASHVHDPTFAEGTKCLALGTYERLGRLPDLVVLPCGNGTLVLGWARGVAELVGLGLVPGPCPIVAVQAAACAPLAAAAEGRPAPPPAPTVAEGIAIAEPPRGRQVLEVVAASGGWFEVVADEEIAPARDDLASRGLFVEPTAACAWAGAQRVAGRRTGAEVLVPLCGAGLKAV